MLIFFTSSYTKKVNLDLFYNLSDQIMIILIFRLENVKWIISRITTNFDWFLITKNFVHWKTLIQKEVEANNY